MREYDEKFYNNDDEDEDSVCLEAFMEGWDSNMDEEINMQEEIDLEDVDLEDVDLITQVFTEVGQTMQMEDAKKKLMDIVQNEPCNEQKALGSLGGAVKNGYLKRNGNKFTRIR